ncbi:MAG: response regulator [Desulfobaccales bacterium]
MAILIVDDEPTQLESIARFLRSKGFDVYQTASGEEAMELLNLHEAGISLVILDYLMTGMTGLEVMDRIRGRAYAPPIILITAYADRDLVANARTRLFDGFLEKPFTPDQLYEEIQRILLAWKGVTEEITNEKPRLVLVDHIPTKPCKGRPIYE